MVFTAKIQKAIRRASLLHEGQKRKCDGSPYVTHLFGVALILAHYISDEDVVVAGILHDVLEDVPSEKYNAQKMCSEFGEHVLAIVQEVTEDKDPESEEKNAESWLRRKEKYIENLKNDSEEALLVAAADKIHNLLSILESYEKYGEEIWQHFRAPRERRLWFYQEVFQVISARLQHPIVAELQSVLAVAEKRFKV